MEAALVKRQFPEYARVLAMAGGYKPRKFVEAIRAVPCPAEFTPSAQGDYAFTHSFSVTGGVISKGPGYSYDSILGTGVNPYARVVDVPRNTRLWVTTFDGQWGGFWSRVLVFVHPQDSNLLTQGDNKNGGVPMARKVWTEEDSVKMDTAAQGAAKELEDICPENVQEVAQWMKKHYLTAGYKRLCRALMVYAS